MTRPNPERHGSRCTTMIRSGRRRRSSKRQLRHWKVKAWKRRTADRRAKNLATLAIERA